MNDDFETLFQSETTMQGFEHLSESLQDRLDITHGLDVEEVEPPELDGALIPEHMQPPTIVQPLFACARMVIVRGVLPGCEVVLDIDGATILDVARTGELAFAVAPLREGARIRAAQKREGQLGAWSREAIVVGHPRRLPKPVIVADPLQCSPFVAVDNLLVGARVACDLDGALGPEIVVRSKRMAVPAPQPLGDGQQVRVRTTLCEDRAETMLESHSDWSMVEREPAVLPTPRIPPQGVGAGGRRVLVENLLIGAPGQLNNVTTGVVSYFNNVWEATWLFGMPEAVRPGDVLTCEQRLCGAPAVSQPITIEDAVEPATPRHPSIAGLCDGDTLVRLRNLDPGAIVALSVDMQVVALAMAGDTMMEIALDPQQPLVSGQLVEATTYFTPGHAARASRTVNAVGVGGKDISIDGLMRVRVPSNVLPDGRLDFTRRNVLDRDKTRLLIVRVKSCCIKGDQLVARILKNAIPEEPPIAAAPLQAVDANTHVGVIELDGVLDFGNYNLEIEGLCEDQWNRENFSVVSFAQPRDDTTPPIVGVTVQNHGAGQKITIGPDDAPGQTIEVFIGDYIQFFAGAYDEGGLASVSFTAQPAFPNQLRYSYRGEKPLTQHMSLTAYFWPERLGVHSFHLSATDLAGNHVSRSPILNIKVDQREPMIASISPSPVEAGKTITLSGSGLAAPTSTDIHFSQAGVDKATVKGKSADNGATIRNVTVPALAAGLYDVSVETGPANKRSAPHPLEVTAKPGAVEGTRRVKLWFYPATQINDSLTGTFWFIFHTAGWRNPNRLATKGLNLIGKVENFSGCDFEIHYFNEIKNNKPGKATRDTELLTGRGVNSTEKFKGLDLKKGIWLLKPKHPDRSNTELRGSWTLFFELSPKSP